MEHPGGIDFPTRLNRHEDRAMGRKYLRESVEAFDHAVAQEFDKAIKGRRDNYDRRLLRRACRLEIERANEQMADKHKVRRGGEHVATFTTTHMDKLKREYGENFLHDRDAIQHAAERDASVAAQKEQLLRGADAVK